MTTSPFRSEPGGRLSAIGERGELWLAARLPEGWFWQPPRTDLGKDGMVVIRDDSDLQNLEFALQVKTTMRPRISRDAVVIPKVSLSSVLYWIASAHPTLSVVVDLSKDRAWYAWHFDICSSANDLADAGKTHIPLRIPLNQPLVAGAWDAIRAEVRRCYRHLYNSLAKTDSYVWIVASVNILCNAARSLYILSQSPVPMLTPDEHTGISLLLEQQQHRNVLVIARKFLHGLDPASALYASCRTWTAAYDALVRDAFPHLGDIPDEVRSGLDSQLLAFRPTSLSASRTKLILMIFDLVRLLTKIHPSGSHNSPQPAASG